MVSLKEKNVFWYTISHSRILILVLTLRSKKKVTLWTKFKLWMFSQWCKIHVVWTSRKLHLAATGCLLSARDVGCGVSQPLGTLSLWELRAHTLSPCSFQEMARSSRSTWGKLCTLFMPVWVYAPVKYVEGKWSY